jgi:NAD(P)H dehydrogenase (quinone)
MSQLASADTPRLGERRAQDRLGDDLRPDAKVLAEGPGRHAGKNYYLSTDVLNGMEIAGVLSRVTDRPIRALIMTPDDLAVGVASGQVVMPDNIESNYAASMLEWVRQTFARAGLSEDQRRGADQLLTLLLGF